MHNTHTGSPLKHQLLLLDFALCLQPPPRLPPPRLSMDSAYTVTVCCLRGFALSDARGRICGRRG